MAHVTEAKAERLQAVARTSVGSLSGPVAETLVQKLVRQLQQSLVAEAELKDLMNASFEALPEAATHLAATLLPSTIPGPEKRNP